MTDPEEKETGFISDSLNPEAVFRFETQLDESLYNELHEQIGPGPAQFYYDACFLLWNARKSQRPATVTHLVAHLLREVDSAVASLIAPFNMPELDSGPGAGVRKVEACLEFLNLPLNSPTGKQWINLQKRDGEKFNQLAHRKNFDSPRRLTSEFIAWVERVKVTHHEVLRAFHGKFLHMVEYVDSIIGCQHPPSNILHRIPQNTQILCYLFSELENADWFVPLKDKGFFTRPPDLERDENGRLHGGQLWPPIPYFEYLAKNAKKAVQQQMLDVILEVGETNDFRIHHHFARIAEHLSVELAKAWAEHEIAWLEAGNETHSFMEEELAKLAAKLFREGELETALSLLAQILAVLPDPEADEKRSRPETDDWSTLLNSRLKPRIRCNPYHYKEILDKQVAEIAAEDPWSVFQLLTDLLEKTVVYDQRDPEETKPHDLFHITRQAIEEDANSREYDFEQNLITALRDTGQLLGRQHSDRIGEMIAYLESNEWMLFRRIALHLLRVLEQAPQDMIRERLLDWNLFHAFNGHHEYFMLIRDRYGVLDPDDQQRILNWIDEAKEKRKQIKEDGQGMPADKRDRMIRSWQYDKLFPIRRYLQGEWKQRFDSLEAEYEPSDFPRGYSSWSGEVKGPRTPKTAEELAAMSNEEVVGFLLEWRPPANRFDPSPSALAGALGKMVETDPERFLDDLDRFLGSELDVTYVRGMCNGLFRAVTEEKSQLLEPALYLCQRLVAEPPEVKNIELPEHVKRDGFDADRDWRPLYSYMIGWIDDLFKWEKQPVFTLRDIFWEIIQPFTVHPDPDEDYDASLGGHRDASNASLNVLRGKALHAMMHYAMWVARSLKQSRPETRPQLDDLPEVKAVLESRLDLDAPFGNRQIDRAIFGQWLPQLVALDEDWVLKNTKRIFPSDPKLRPLRMAAFATTVLYVGRLYDKLIPFYLEEVQLLEGSEESDDETRTYEQRLSEHVVLLYAWGKAGLEEGGLVERLFSLAPSRLTGHAMDFLGHDMRRNHDEPVNEEVQTRLRDLWTWRVERCGGVENLPPEELKAFGYWFAWGEFEPDWAFPSLIAALKGPGVGHGGMTVFEKLSELFPDHPDQSLEAAYVFVENSDDNWFYRGTRKDKGIWTLLQQAVKHPSGEIQNKSVELINIIGSMGNLEYRELLPKT